MNVLKSLNNNKPVSDVNIFVKFIEINNPCSISIETDYVDKLLDKNIKPNSISNIRFNLLNQNGESVNIMGVKRLSSSRSINASLYYNNNRNNKIINSSNNHYRKIELILKMPMTFEELNTLVKVFNSKIDIDHYSFRQEYYNILNI